MQPALLQHQRQHLRRDETPLRLRIHNLRHRFACESVSDVFLYMAMLSRRQASCHHTSHEQAILSWAQHVVKSTVMQLPGLSLSILRRVKLRYCHFHDKFGCLGLLMLSMS